MTFSVGGTLDRLRDLYVDAGAVAAPSPAPAPTLDLAPTTYSYVNPFGGVAPVVQSYATSFARNFYSQFNLGGPMSIYSGLPAGVNLPAPYYGRGPGFDWGDLVDPRAWSDVLGRIGGGLGGSPYMQNYSVPEGYEPGDYPGVGFGMGDPGSAAFWKPTATGYRLRPDLMLPDPTGKFHFIRDVGRPMLFSGDFAAARRVARVASRAARRMGRRRGGR